MTPLTIHIHANWSSKSGGAAAIVPTFQHWVLISKLCSMLIGSLWEINST
jgi:hypothetical protein